MPPVVATAEVGRAAAEVFAYATDPARFPEWQAGVTEGHLTVTNRRSGCSLVSFMIVPLSLSLVPCCVVR
jgi:hypothetical protein